MLHMDRRAFGRLLGGATLVAPMLARAQSRPKLVVIGGGAGGATAARYVAKDSEGAIDVTLIEANPAYTTCFFGNLAMGGFYDWDSLTHSYDRLASNYGVTMVQAMAQSVDRDAREVVMADGSRVPYDRLIVSPGIDFRWDATEGYSEAAVAKMPHAYKGGTPARELSDRLHALENGQNVVLVAPPNPFRCPPGPYERASMFAHVLKAKGHDRSKVFVLDHKDSFSKQALFAEGWTRHYGQMIEWFGPSIHGGIERVDPDTGEVHTDLDVFQGDLVNFIPAQKAGAIAHAAGLTNESGFCPVDPATMRSTMDPNIFVLGDSSIAGDMPKSGFSANSQAKVAAMIVRSELIGARAFPARFANTCWSLIAAEDGVKVGGQYAPTEEKIATQTSFISQTGEDAALRRATFEESLGWYAGITADMFG
ncbi:NAD(P)/FAD-dependent oxidoreductase [Rubrimonas sp.]|uniref:NAD(P)/FAD-dependent oxidoreductase n=1 Tax=Rubrimonas sp. TaxID=2036015 RepID=UPI002FDC90D8